MGSSSPSTQTVRNETVPDPVTQQWRQNLFGEAQNLYNQGAPEYFPGSTVVPFSQQTQQGLGMLQQQAAGGSPNYQAANDAAGRALSGYNPAMAGAASVAGGSMRTTAGVDTLQNAASGGAMNPYLDSLYGAASRPVIDSVNTQFAKSGRYGGNAAHTGAMTQQLGNLASSIYAPAYEAERGRQMGAASQLASIQQGDFNRQLAASELYGGLYSQANQDAARAQALLPSIFQYGGMAGQQMLGVGAAHENLSGEYIDDAMARYNYQQNAPWDYLGQYASIVNGLPQFNTSTTNQTGRASQNRTMGALGGAATGASMGSNFGPYGALIGGLFGAAGGYMGTG